MLDDPHQAAGMNEAGKLIAVAGMILMASPDRPAMACSTDDIAVERAEVIVEGRTTYVVGALSNGCSEGTGVLIRITLKDDEGKVVLSGDFWPANLRNIPPRDRRGFTYVVSPADANPKRHATSIAVDIVAVRKW
jgi:hypothetical protein